MIEFHEEITADQIFQLRNGISKLDSGVLSTTGNKLLDRAVGLMHDLIQANTDISREQYSAYIAEKLGLGYVAVTKLFLQLYGVTLPRYIEIQQIERVKELILYENRKLDEIVELLHYKSKAQLTRIFKENTGLTPTYYKRIKTKRLQVLEGTSQNEGGNANFLL